MNFATRKEMLVAQVLNIESIMSNDKLDADEKVYQITSVMSFLNELVSSIVEPIRKDVKDHTMIDIANDNFIEFLPKEEDSR